MEIIERTYNCKGRSDVFRLYSLGDIHVGARNCAEAQIKRLIATKIKPDPNAIVLLGGDLMDCIKPSDFKRFGFDNLPDWILEGKADEVRDSLRDIAHQQLLRVCKYLEPIKDKIIGAIEGNHEEAIRRINNQDIHRALCEKLDIPDLTDSCFIRLRFRRANKATSVVIIFAQHGWGGGRTPGAEPNKLARMAEDKDADILLRGHSHTFCILPPIAQIGIPRKGQLPFETDCRYKRAANWGCWLKSYARGASTYDSRAGYPARPLSHLEVIIEPHKCKQISNREKEETLISMQEIVL